METPRLLLIGAGKFGKNHLRALLTLHRERKIRFVGAVVSTEKSKKELSSAFGIQVYTQLTDSLLQSCDAVDIATPSSSHYSLVKRCLRSAHVLVEKPLALRSEQALELDAIAKKNMKILMVGHIYRFHSVIETLKDLLRGYKGPAHIEGEFLDPPLKEEVSHVLLERLHFQDIIDYLFGARQGFSYSRKKGNSFLVHSRYHNSLSASFHIGYSGEEKKRILRASLKGQEILCDLQKGELRITKKGVSTTLNRSEGMLPLEKEIQTFVNILKGSKAEYVDGKKGANIIQEIEAIKPLKKQRRPSVAVIGGGIFGATCASLLGKSCSVTLFERKNDLMLESSFVNQYRHHKGYHYPRSPETVEECQRSAAAFMQEYGQAIQEEFPSYYCVAKKGSRTSPEGFLKFCRENLLPVVREFPSEGVLSRENVALSLKTSEGIYHYPTLKALIRSKLEKNANVSLKFLHQVVGAKILPDGKKELTVRGKNVHRQKFDYVINATYANINAFMSWLSFPEKDLRIDLMELLVIRLPIPKMSITMMDGPFATFVTTGDDGLFTLGHVRESVHSTVMPKNGKIPKFSRRSNGKNILQESIAWYPILKKAKVIDSRFVIRGINAYREHDDARPSDVISHGFGCWSILGGKVITCVSTARLIEKEINEGIMP